jgi:hypothetical protein
MFSLAISGRRLRPVNQSFQFWITRMLIKVCESGGDRWLRGCSLLNEKRLRETALHIYVLSANECQIDEGTRLQKRNPLGTEVTQLRIWRQKLPWLPRHFAPFCQRRRKKHSMLSVSQSPPPIFIDRPTALTSIPSNRSGG